MNDNKKPTKTKIRIIKSLLCLANRKPLSEISITELCNASKTSRMTFYRNYSTIDDIFNSYLNYIFYEYEKSSNTTGSYKNIINITICFEFMYQYRQFISGLLKCKLGSIFYEKLKSYIFNKWLNESNQIELFILSGTLYSVFEYWVKYDFKNSPNELSKKIIKILNWE